MVMNDALEDPVLDAEQQHETREVPRKLHAAGAADVAEPDLRRIEADRGRIEGRNRPGNDIQPVPGTLLALQRHVQPAPRHPLGDLPAELPVRRLHRFHDLLHAEETLHVFVGQNQYVLVSHCEPLVDL